MNPPPFLGSRPHSQAGSLPTSLRKCPGHCAPAPLPGQPPGMPSPSTGHSRTQASLLPSPHSRWPLHHPAPSPLQQVSAWVQFLSPVTLAHSSGVSPTSYSNFAQCPGQVSNLTWGRSLPAGLSCSSTPLDTATPLAREDTGKPRSVLPP